MIPLQLLDFATVFTNDVTEDGPLESASDAAGGAEDLSGPGGAGASPCPTAAHHQVLTTSRNSHFATEWLK